MSPCLDCAKVIINSGIKKVVFNEMYRKDEGMSIWWWKNMRKYALYNIVLEKIKEFDTKEEMWRWLNEQELPLKGGPYKVVIYDDVQRV